MTGRWVIHQQHVVNLDKKAFTLVEILVSMIILAIVMTGLVNVFVSGRQFLLHSRNRMSAAEIGKRFIDPLQSQVRQDTWGAGGNLLNNGSRSSSSGIYTASYTVSTLPSSAQTKKVKTVISWTD